MPGRRLAAVDQVLLVPPLIPPLSPAGGTAQRARLSRDPGAARRASRVRGRALRAREPLERNGAVLEVRGGHRVAGADQAPGVDDVAGPVEGDDRTDLVSA